MFSNFISRLKNAIQKPKNTSKSASSCSFDNLQNEPENALEIQSPTYNVYANKRIKILKTLKMDVPAGVGNGINEKVKKNIDEEEVKEEDTLSDNSANTSILQKLIVNTNLTVTRVNSEKQPTNSECANTSNTKIEEIMKQIPKKISKELDDSADTFNLKLINKKNIDAITKAGNDTNSKVESLNSNDNSNIPTPHDQTTMFLKEFDEILAEVQINDDSKAINDDSLSLGDIDEILNNAMDDNNPYSFQEIKTSEDVFNETNASIETLSSYLLGADTRLFDTISTSCVTKDDTDIISISSDDPESDSIICISDNPYTDLKSVQNESISSSDTIKKYAGLNDTVNNNKLLKENKCKETDSGKTEQNTESTILKQSNLETISIDTKDNLEPSIKMMISSEGNNTTNVEEPNESAKNITQEFDSTVKSITEDADMDNKSIQIKECKKLNFIQLTLYNSATEHETESKPLEDSNLDAISTAEEDNMKRTSNISWESDDCGYHSSDFEFISEEEAKKVGIVKNVDSKRYSKESRMHNPGNEILRRRQTDHYYTLNTVQNDPYGPGPSSRNQGKDCSGDNVRVDEADDKSYMENYVIPDDREVVEMFRGLPAMPMSEIHFLENKSIITNVPMLVQYDGVGFDMRDCLRFDSSDDEEYREEAQQTVRKILEMYPQHNRRFINPSRRRRRRRR